ncbi:MAG: hypothetical protein LH614_15065 [Pyrinomonadaceae bacterium]|nr:hypothetical protein [Pyrinomonadaceae bacterium]
MENYRQPNLFDEDIIETAEVLLYALGEFQSRGKLLADRELALDRLRGAFKRAAEKFGTEELSDEEIAQGLEKLNAKVVKVPNFVAKHPFRVTINDELAEKSKLTYQAHLKND